MGVTRRWKRAGHQASTPRRVAVGWRAFGKMAPMVHTGIPTSVSSPSILSPLPVPSLPLLTPPFAVDRALFSFFLFPFFENLYRLELVSKRRGGGEGRGGKKERREEGEE